MTKKDGQLPSRVCQVTWTPLRVPYINQIIALTALPPIGFNFSANPDPMRIALDEILVLL